MAIENVRNARIARGITGVAMAAHLGMNFPTYYKKETGQIKWSLPEAKAVADFFGTTIDALFFDQEVSVSDNN